MTTDDARVNDERIEVVIEVPKGSRNKYEINHDTGEVWLDRMLFTATQYPANYGFVPLSLGDDGDPIDVLVLLEEPCVPGCHLWARPVAVCEMQDEKGGDAKIIAVPWGDPRWESVHDLGDLAPHLVAEIHHFFEVYKTLEPGKATQVSTWGDRARAQELIALAYAAHGRHG
ncbi:MAG: inorganic diphosphatase [Acidimicrobiales bacterium]